MEEKVTPIYQSQKNITAALSEQAPGITSAVNLPFGKHRGKPLHEVPLHYLEWLAQEEHQPDTFKPAAYIQAEARALLNQLTETEGTQLNIEARQATLEERFTGTPGETTEYLVQFEGDLTSNFHTAYYQYQGPFTSLEATLNWLEENKIYPDIEDDRITVWETLPSGHRKAVWSAWGWHYVDGQNLQLEQGKYPSHDQTMSLMTYLDQLDVEELETLEQ